MALGFLFVCIKPFLAHRKNKGSLWTVLAIAKPKLAFACAPCAAFAYLGFAKAKVQLVFAKVKIKNKTKNKKKKQKLAFIRVSLQIK